MVGTELKELIRGIRLVVFDFDGVFTNNMVYVFEDGAEAVRCWRGDGIGLRKLERLGISLVVVSSEPNPVIRVRSDKLCIRCIHAVKDKRTVVEAVAGELGLSLAQVAFVGNDINDLACLSSVGFPIVVQDAHLDVVPCARYQTRARGGHGAVREICDLFESVLAPKKE